MKYIDFFLAKCEALGESKNAIVYKDQNLSYTWFAERIKSWLSDFDEMSIEPGTVVAIESDFAPNTLALFMALIERRTILVPLLRNAPEQTKENIYGISQAAKAFKFNENDEYQLVDTGNRDNHEYFNTLRERGTPGLVLFSSGSTGQPKAAVHDFTLLLEKFRKPRPTIDMLSFLLFDHIGGINTFLHCFANGGTLFAIQDRSPDAICEAIAKHGIMVLPTSPTFLNLMLISEAYKRHDLSSLKTITYGAEPMPESTLQRLSELFPNIKLQQTYGLIELGIFRSKSKSNNSLWVKLDMDYRIVEGILQIKTKSTMLGYLNAENPFTEDGYYITGDAVAQDGEYLRIFGRKSEMINVGGEKVFPQEVENVIQEVENVQDVTVYKERNPITGNMVCAKVSLVEQEEPKVVKARIKKHCRERLESFKVPVKIKVTDESFMTARGKKRRVKV